MEAIQTVYDFMDDAKVFYLATVDGDQPRVRPYGATVLFEGKIYVMAMAGTNAPKQLAENPKCEICAFKGKTLRITCTLVPDERKEAKEAMSAKMPALEKQLGLDGMLMYYVKDATATISTMTGECETYTF